jgi:hypothetical protein
MDTDSSDAQYAQDPSSLGSILADLEARGYRGQFAAREGSRLACFTCSTEHDAAATAMTALRRTEGASDPDDMLAIVALTCPSCQAKGTAVLTYGPEAPMADAEVLRALEDDREGTGIQP